MKVVVRFFDGLSQVAGGLIPVRVRGTWRTYTLSPNESISGASHRYRLQGVFFWPEKAIDFVAALFGDDEHCAKAYSYDYYRAERYRQEVDRLGGPTFKGTLDGH